MSRTVARPSRAFLPLLALASCSSSKTIDQQAKRAASTAQAEVLLSDAWLSGAAPSHYASSALQTFAETLAAGRQVESASPSDRGKRDSLVAAVTRLSNAQGGPRTRSRPNRMPRSVRRNRSFGPRKAISLWPVASILRSSNEEAA
ncbi:hypothetical protein [Mesorhizobium sp. CA16]|uniref:hypothetical protein n=1 Tax=Mesorhizobium sp. CA16 TaxID=588496 RepID=UPI001CCC7B78|nr:hypothetical protein [Mesorhizobium sp. CA16]MBZ9910655.1 hypothetical protein [Mesorhizobium sp. CA16]